MGLFSSKSKDKSTSASKDIVLSNGENVTVSNTVDCLGDSCPRPQLMTKKALAAASPEQVIEVLVDNPTSMEALPPMCEALSATHLETLNANNGWQVIIRKNA